MNQPQQLNFREVLQIKPVRRLWLAQIVSVFGDFLAIFAALSVVSFKLHGTPAQVTLISVAFMAPFAFIGPLAGVFVDRWNVKRTLITSDLMRALLALGLVLANSLNQFYAILFALSAVSTFFMPAQTITLRTLVPKEGLMAANALMQQAFQLMRIVSPGLFPLAESGSRGGGGLSALLLINSIKQWLNLCKPEKPGGDFFRSGFGSAVADWSTSMLRTNTSWEGPHRGGIRPQ